METDGEEGTMETDGEEGTIETQIGEVGMMGTEGGEGAKERKGGGGVCAIFSLVVLLFTAVFPLQLFKGHAGLVRCISVEPQGQWMASGKWFSHCQKTQSPSSTVMGVECTEGVECRNTHTHTHTPYRLHLGRSWYNKHCR